VDADQFPGLGSDLVYLPRALRVGNKFFDVVTQAGPDLLRRRGTDTQDPALKTAATCDGCLLVASHSNEWNAQANKEGSRRSLHARRHGTLLLRTGARGHRS
jgi:hypothetical protein